MLIGYLLSAPNAEPVPNRAIFLTNLPVLAYLENRDNVPWFDEQEHDTTGSGSPLGALTTLAYSVGIYKLYLQFLTVSAVKRRSTKISRACIR